MFCFYSGLLPLHDLQIIYFDASASLFAIESPTYLDLLCLFDQYCASSSARDYILIVVESNEAFEVVFSIPKSLAWSLTFLAKSIVLCCPSHLERH